MLLGYKSGMSIDLLPYDAEVEYLQSSGNSSTVVKMWVDTGVEALANTAMEVTFQYTDTSYGYVMGQGQLNGSRFGVAGIRSNSRLWSLAYNSWHDFSISADTSIHTFSLDGVLKTGSVDGTSISFSDSYTSEGGTIGLFCRNCSGGTVQNFGCNGKLYSCKIWDNGNLVRDFIPVRKGTVGYLYDRVSGKLFGNAGTGDFVVGPDVVPVEYIESHGTEYIDTGFVATTDTVCNLSMMLAENETGTSGCFLGALDGSAHRFHLTRTDFGLNGYFFYSNGNAEPFKVCNFELNAKEWYCKKDGVATASTSTKYVPAVTVYLFARHYSSSYDRPSKIRMFYCDFLNNDAFALKYRPVRVGTEGAMMDVLTRRIYRNAGTGAFTYGEDLPYPIPA